MIDAGNLHRRACGICKRAEEVEHRADLQLAPYRHGVARGLMHGGRKEKADSDFVNRPADALGGQIDPHPELFEDIGGAAARTDRAIAVLGDAYSGAGDHESYGC